jgi:hypothetical protein
MSRPPESQGGFYLISPIRTTLPGLAERCRTGHLAISDSSEPNRAAVEEDWLCDITQWSDTTLAWRYAVPVIDARDRELLRPICAALAASRRWSGEIRARRSGRRSLKGKA